MPRLLLFVLSLLSTLFLLPSSVLSTPAPGTLLFTYPPAQPVGLNYSFNGVSQLSIAPVLSGACSSSPILYAADRFNNRVLAIDSSTGALLRVYNNSGSLQQPAQAVSDGASLYITDFNYPPSVTKLDLVSGVQQARYFPNGNSLFGLGLDLVNGYLYFTLFPPTTRGVAQKLRLSDLQPVANISAACYPVALAVAGGNVYVNDVCTENTTVAMFSVNYPNPSTITTLHDRNNFTSSFGLTVDSQGNLYQNAGGGSLRSSRVVVWAPNGTELLLINVSAYGVAVDCRGQIYASDGSGHVYQFQGLASSTTPTGVRGDPSFVGPRGQHFQVHGLDGAVYGLISDRQVQVNAKFGFLSSGDCLRDAIGRPLFTCWSHPGSYLTALSIRSRTAVLSFIAGPALSGFERIAVEGSAEAELQVGEQRAVGEMNIHYRDLRTFVVRGAGLYELEVQNSDGFLNLVRVDVSDWVELTSAVKSHGLLGQTWREDVRGDEVKEVQGLVDDYVVEDGLMGCRFLHSLHSC